MQTNKRMMLALKFFGLVALALIIRLAYVQIVKADFYQEKALSQWTRGTSVAAKRGNIVDRTGVVLAQSGTAKTVIAKPPQIAEKDREKVAEQLAEALDLDKDDVLKQLQKTDSSQVNIKRKITDEEEEKVLALHLGSAVDFAIEDKRNYPEGALASQLIGYTDIDGNGQEGLEAIYNKYLSGTEGKIISETDMRGNEIPYGAEQMVAAEDGAEVMLTIDAVVQTSMEATLKEYYKINNVQSSIQGIAMNVKTGEILAMATYPSFDLNDPPRNDANTLLALSRNRVIADAYEPGSTFKILTLAAGLDSGAITEASTFYCSSYKMVDGEKIKCWRTIPHGAETLAQGVQNSCNPVFMEIALGMGTETFYEYLEAFGLGTKTGINLTGESTGIVRNQKYVRNVDLARIGFGQSVAVTPIQLITAVSAAVNGGNLMEPYVVKEIRSADGQVLQSNEPTVVRRVISEDTSELVASLLEGVVKEGGGKNAYIPGYHVGGKTGTAQKYENGKIAQGKYVASFIGFAPAYDPEYIVLILVDEPSISSQVFGSTVAAPAVRQVLYTMLKHYQVKPQYDEDEQGLNMSVTIPDLTGMTLAEANSVLKELNLQVTADGEGTVVGQAPSAGGEPVPENTGVILYMSEKYTDEEEETTEITVPDLSNKTVAQAYEILTDLGLKMETIGDTSGTVQLQSPSAGTKVEAGETVTVTLRVNLDN